MNRFEYLLMNTVCDYHVDRFGIDAIVTKEKFFKRWEMKDFTPTLQEVMKNNLSTLEYGILKARYADRLNDTLIKEQFNLYKDNINQIENNAISALSNIYAFKELYLGKEAFNRLFDSKRHEINKILKEANYEENEED